ncbi:MAG: replicative DNA helicase [Candidatus Eisenbacteria bacterium]|uniref:Replicative DNA helicase n=1 Tax=Eiseniibacteriota bacterium TaxID=2212470 RepID=A0A538T3Y6_UNCEI|nr:MAG: replicative DNA helicase [Candidatus Eisenbacteria bacterium]
MESAAGRVAVEQRRPFEKDDTVEGGRVPPQSLDAERSVLGAMLLSRDAIAAAIQHLDERAFYRETHRKIWRSMVVLFDRNEAVDLVTLVEELKRRKELEAVGGATYLTSLDQFVATAANVEHYCKIVNEKATLRRLIEVGTEIVGECYDQRKEPAALLDRAEQAIFAISDDRLRTGFHPMRQLVLQGYSAIEEYRQRKVHVTGVPSGFYDLDEMTAGFQKSDFIVIAGRPSMGKTSLAMNIAENVAVHLKPAERQAIAVFSLEMSKESLVQRLMCSLARVDIHKIRRGYASNDEYKRLQNAAAQLHEAPIYIDDTAAIGILEMRAKSRRLVSEVPLGLIVIDYLQLIRGPESSENRQQEISAISRSLKALAKELQVPVVALSQLSRAVETRGGSKRPVLSDLRESGAIEQDADVVLFVYRPEVYEADPANRDGKAEIIVSKQRNGPTGSVNLAFVSECTRFESLRSVPEPKF